VEILLCRLATARLGRKSCGFGIVDIFIRSRRRVDPYFHLPRFGPLDGWQKVWFFLRNDTVALLPVFTGSHPIPQHNWGHGVA
jgi:hypothetical protein